MEKKTMISFSCCHEPFFLFFGLADSFFWFIINHKESTVQNIVVDSYTKPCAPFRTDV